MAPSSTTKLSKRQKKALAHHKGKGKARIDQIPDIPESDSEEGEEEKENQDAIENEEIDQNEEQTSRKRKRQDSGKDNDEEKGSNEESKAESKMAKRRRKAREKKQAAIEAGEVADKTFTVFVGNLPYAVTKEEIQSHFASCGELQPKIRLATPKEEEKKPSRTDPTASKPKTKGYAFVEFKQASSLQLALKLHQSKLRNRLINVELTAGGGGNSEARQAKLQASRERLLKQRSKSLDKNNRRSETNDQDSKNKRKRGQRHADGTFDADIAASSSKKKSFKPNFSSGSNAIKVG